MPPSGRDLTVLWPGHSFRHRWLDQTLHLLFRLSQPGLAYALKRLLLILALDDDSLQQSLEAPLGHRVVSRDARWLPGKHLLQAQHLGDANVQSCLA
jgi:hypothetical protein